MQLLIKNGQVIDPANKINAISDVLVADGKILDIKPSIEAPDAMLIDAQDHIVCPGFIDMHTHLREPGFEYKEDIASGTRAAAIGGFTSICCMPNTNPVIDNAAVAAFVKERAKKAGVVNVYPIGSITKNENGMELSEMGALVAAGCLAFSDDGRPVTSSYIMRNALDYARMFSLPILSHCEDTSLSRDGQMHEGFYSTILGLKGIPAAAEEIMVARDIILAELTGGHVHICHASTRGSMELIRDAKSRGVKVTCEATPHHLTLSAAVLEGFQTNAKVNPPLRTTDDLEALCDALLDGTVDCIATDHAPHQREVKDCEFNNAAFGISGFETAVPVIMDYLVNQNKLSIEEMVELFTIGPAEILNLDKGTLTPGKIADITIINPNIIKKVTSEKFYSKGKNNPYSGMQLKGWPSITIVKGEIVARDGKIVKEM
jgi:dihydroorotase